jgi:hypothetical protein
MSKYITNPVLEYNNIDAKMDEVLAQEDSQQADLKAAIHSATEKTTPANDDEFPAADSAATYNVKRFKWSNILAAISATLSDIAASTHAATSKTPPVDADEIPLADSAATFGLKKLTFANLKVWVLALFAPVVLTPTITAGAYTADLSAADTFVINPTEATAITLSNGVAGKTNNFVIIQPPAANWAVTFVLNGHTINWVAKTPYAYTATNAAKDIVSLDFYTASVAIGAVGLDCGTP